MKYKNQNHFLLEDVIPIITISFLFIIITTGLACNISCIQGNVYTFQDISLLNSEDPYTKISPIFIDNSDPNYNWNKTSFENDWCSGQGTAESPYIIKNIMINGQNSSSCIVIRDSSVNFRIENCILLNSSIGSILNFKAGIRLENVENGVIINNEISYNNGNGLVFILSNNNTISGNTINNNKNGIDLYLSGFNVISENYINNNEKGVNLYIFSNNNTISGNNLIGNKFFIAEDLSCTGNIIQNNIYWEEIPEEEDEIPIIPLQDYTFFLLIAAAVGVAGGLSVGIVVQRRRTVPMAGIPPKKGLKGGQMLLPPIVDAREYRPDMTRINLNAEETIKKIKEEDSFLTREAIEQLRQKEKRFEAVKEVKKERLHNILNNHEIPEQKLTIIESPDQILKEKDNSGKRITKKVVNGKK